MVQLSAYKQGYDQKINRPSKLPWMYFCKESPPQEKPWTGPSGGILEENIVILRHDSSMHIIATEDLPVGQEVEVEDSGIDDSDLYRARLMYVYLTF